ncbi:MAG: hypothetical protein LUE27_06650 [Clostridia bacterium]|nr:hypothetical protein [Clostridia bacterium]
MIILLQEMFMQLFLWLLMLVDGITDLFNAICGIDDVTYAGDSVNIIESTLINSTVQSVFWCVIILAVGLACIFTIVAVIKNMIKSDRALSEIVGKFFLAILGTIAMLLVVVLGIMIANELLRILSDIFRLNTNLRLSSVIFDACTGKWINGFSINDFDVSTTTVSDLFGSYDTAMWIWPTSWKMNGMIDPGEFYFAPAIIAVICLAWFLLNALVTMARRLFEIVYCYFCMPVAMSTLPLDEGARFKNWTTTFLSKILLAFGCVLSVNIFSLLLPVYTSLSIPGAGSFENALFMLILIIGGAMVIPVGQAIFVRIFASGEDRAGGVHLTRAAGRVEKFATNAVIATGGATMFAYKAIKNSIHKASGSSGGSGDGEDGAYRDPDGTDSDSGSYSGADESGSYTGADAGSDPFTDDYSVTGTDSGAVSGGGHAGGGGAAGGEGGDA